MTKWIAAECDGAMLWVLEDLLALGAKRLDTLQGSVQVIDMEVEVHRRPVALVPASIVGAG